MAATYQFAHQASRREIALKKDDQVSARQEDGCSKDDDGGLSSDGLPESEETGSWKHKAANDWQEGGQVNRQRDSCASSKPDQCIQHSIHWLLLLAGIVGAVGWVHSKIGIVHGS